MTHRLLITVRLHDSRFHGAGSGVPSPARLFQALVAGAALSGPQELDAFRESLRWLERRPPPIVAAPLGIVGQTVTVYVPNNDADTIQGDPRRVAKIRTTKKIWRPHILEPEVPFLYAWDLEEDENGRDHAEQIVQLADRLYQLGWGVDMAWAHGEILSSDEADQRLARHTGQTLRPTPGRGGRPLACPAPGSFESLAARHEARGNRFADRGQGKLAFAPAPRPRFRKVVYDGPTASFLFDLRTESKPSRFAPQPSTEVVHIITTIRDAAATRLKTIRGDRGHLVDRYLLGKEADGSHRVPVEQRVRLLPLLSRGHPRADHEVRRILLHVPPSCPLRADDLRWALSGLAVSTTRRGVLIPSEDLRMLRHYGLDDETACLRWRSVTPLALPLRSHRRRRSDEQRAVTARVLQALRHEGRLTAVASVKVQREPFTSRGARAEAFAVPPRFPGACLWHVEITFREPLRGPLALGDGRFLGLGVMAPEHEDMGVLALGITEGLKEGPIDGEALARSLRRALMSRVQRHLGANSPLPPFFSGHERGGSPTSHPHLAFAYDRARQRLLIVMPHATEHRNVSAQQRAHRRTLEEALAGFHVLHAGSAGRLKIAPWISLSSDDPLLSPSKTWESSTDYVVTRHLPLGDASRAVEADVALSCRRAGLPRPTVTVRNLHADSGRGLAAHVHIAFPVAVSGPLLLGRTRFLGGGLFIPCSAPPTPPSTTRDSHTRRR